MKNDILAHLFVSVDNFKYDRLIKNIDPDDLIDQNRLYKKTFYTLFIGGFSALFLIKKRMAILNFIKNKITTDEINFFPNKDTGKITELYGKENLKRAEQKNFDNDGYIIDVKMQPAAKTYTRKNKPEDIIKKVDNYSNYTSTNKIFKQIGAIREEGNANLMEKSKNYFTDEKGKHKLFIFFKYTLVYFPLIMIFSKLGFDFCYFNLGYYFKYQPLIDAYYNQINK